MLGGKLTLEGPQPPEDALWLAAAVEGLSPQSRVLDAAAGSGVAGLALLCRCPRLSVTGVELQPDLATLAARNAARNGFGTYRCAVGNILSHTPAQLYDAVLCNPPFYTEGDQSPSSAQRLARHQPKRLLTRWVTHLLSLTTGPLYVLLHQQNKAELKALATQLLLAAEVVPLQSHPTRPAKRLLARLHKNTAPTWWVEEPLQVYETTLRQKILENGEGLTAWPRLKCAG